MVFSAAVAGRTTRNVLAAAYHRPRALATGRAIWNALALARTQGTVTGRASWVGGTRFLKLPLVALAELEGQWLSHSTHSIALAASFCMCCLLGCVMVPLLGRFGQTQSGGCGGGAGAGVGALGLPLVPPTGPEGPPLAFLAMADGSLFTSH